MEKEIMVIPSREMFILKKGKAAIKVVMYASKHHNLSLEQRTCNARHVKMIRDELTTLKLMQATHDLISLM